MDDDYIRQQAEGWQEIGRFHHEYDRNPPAQRPETADGPGATLALTEGLRDWLSRLLRRHQVCTMLDAACGDWAWMRLVDLGATEYTGWDVDPVRIDTCRRRIAGGDFIGNSIDGENEDLPLVFRQVNRPNAVFETVNLLTVPEIGYYDLVLCRDTLMHVTNEYVSAILEKVRTGGSLLLLATTFPDSDNAIRRFDPGAATWCGYMETPVDLTAAPFNLGPPIEAFTEEAGPWGVLARPRQLGLWRLNEP